jgi:hypothetical protein
LKPFLTTLKSVFSTFCGKILWSYLQILRQEVYLKYDALEVEVIVKARIGFFDTGYRRWFNGWTWIRRHVKRRRQPRRTRKRGFLLVFNQPCVTSWSTSMIMWWL